MRLAWLDCSLSALRPQMLMREPQHFVSLDSGQKSTNARCMGRMDAQCSLKLPAPSRGASAATHCCRRWLIGAGRAGTSDAIRHRDTAVERPVVAGKRGRRVQSLAPSPPRRRRALLGNDGGWRRGDVASSPRVVRRSRGASLRHARGRGLATRARPSGAASRRGLRDGVEPTSGRRRSSLREVLVLGSGDT